MGDVYRARDTRLQRDVALKFLTSARDADPVAKERLIREARAASMLDHPNVCTVYEVDESADGRLFIAMAYCPGRTIEERLCNGGISPEEVGEIGRQIAEGLTAAHARGIVHRDVKPGNIIITDESRVKIVDFGIAQLAETRLTREGGSVGTPAYMAPEQIHGATVDARADVWAFGTLLYEMLTGRRPFSADYEQAAMYRILNDEPDPVDDDLPAACSSLVEIARACLQKDPALRPTMREVADWLRPDARGPVATARAIPSSVWHASRHRRGALMAVGGALVLLAGVVFFTAAPAIPAEKYIAVLPLSIAGDSEEDRLLADGLTITLTNQLAQLASFTDEAYWVVPHSEIRGRDVGSPSLARRAFGATLVLEGGLVRSATGFRLTLSLIDARTLRTLRAVDLSIPSADLARLHERAISHLSGMMHMHLAATSHDVLRAGETTDPVAFDLYLRARALLERYEVKENLEAAVGLLQQAVAEDANFGAAYAALGEANWRLYEATKDEIYVPLALRHLERALTIDDRISAAHITMARLYAGTDRLEQAQAAVDRIIAQDPRNADAFITLGRIQNQAGRIEEAEEAFRRAIELRPSFWGGYNELGVFYYRRGRYGEAEWAWRQVVLLTPDNPRGFSNLGAVYFQMERFEEAAEHFERSIAIHPTRAGLANLATLYLERLEDLEKAAESYRRALEIEDGDYQLWYRLAIVYHRMGAEEEMNVARGEAIRRAERQIQLNPEDQRAMVELANMYRSSDDTRRALELLNQAANRTLDDIELNYLIAEIYELMGEREQAIVWLCRSVEAGYPVTNVERAEHFAALRASPDYERVRACEPAG